MRKQIDLDDAKVLATELGCREAARRLGVTKSFLYYHSQRRRWNLRLMQYFARRRREVLKYLAKINRLRTEGRWSWPPDKWPKARESYLASQKQLEQKRRAVLAEEQRRQAILAKYPPI